MEITETGKPLMGQATQLVVVRDGETTTLTVSTDTDASEPVTIIVPIRGTIVPDGIKSIPQALVDKLATYDAPRLVEYVEQDPCAQYEEHPLKKKPAVVHVDKPSGDGGVPAASFSTAEYEVTIEDGASLDAWLTQRGATDAVRARLKPWMDRAATFVMARVPAHTKMSPLRIRYQSPALSLPVDEGDPDNWVVHVLGRNQRYEVADARNVSVPTNLDGSSADPAAFADAYDALLNDELKVGGVVVTEYARDVDTCDPCTLAALSAGDLVTLGTDGKPGYVVTRMRSREVAGSLIAAPPIVGGREFRGGDGALESGTRVGSANQFQARYAIRHAWTGPIACTHPIRGRWSASKVDLATPIAAPLAAVHHPTSRAWFVTDAGLDASMVDGSTTSDAGVKGASSSGCSTTAEGAWWPVALLLYGLRLIRRRVLLAGRVRERE
jgi:MYXO-CTERM domain-containing protein